MVPLAVTLLLILVVLGALAYALGVALGKRGEPMRDWVVTRWRRRRDALVPEARPIEEIAADLHRLGSRFHGLDPRASYAKTEAVRLGYDRALDECCAALGMTHLLAILPAGHELDVERERVEEQLIDAGVRLPRTA
jgi:hypothetical protein